MNILGFLSDVAIASERRVWMFNPPPLQYSIAVRFFFFFLVHYLSTRPLLWNIGRSLLPGHSFLSGSMLISWAMKLEECISFWGHAMRSTFPFVSSVKLQTPLSARFPVCTRPIIPREQWQLSTVRLLILFINQGDELVVEMAGMKRSRRMSIIYGLIFFF